jgi:hypothetical protein
MRLPAPGWAAAASCTAVERATRGAAPCGLDPCTRLILSAGPPYPHRPPASVLLQTTSCRRASDPDGHPRRSGARSRHPSHLLGRLAGHWPPFHVGMSPPIESRLTQASRRPLNRHGAKAGSSGLESRRFQSASQARLNQAAVKRAAGRLAGHWPPYSHGATMLHRDPPNSQQPKHSSLNMHPPRSPVVDPGELHCLPAPLPSRRFRLPMCFQFDSTRSTRCSHSRWPEASSIPQCASSYAVLPSQPPRHDATTARIPYIIRLTGMLRWPSHAAASCPR